LELKFENNKEKDAVFNDVKVPRKRSARFPFRLVIILLLLGYFYINGTFDDVKSPLLDDVKSPLKVVENEVSPSDQLALDFKKMSKGDRKKIQYALKELGLYSGVIDGLWGVNSKNSLIRYDLDHSTNLSLRRITNSLNRQVVVPEYISLEGYPPPIKIKTEMLYRAKKFGGVAPLHITAGSNRDFYVKLRRSDDSTDVMTVLVKKGDTFIGKAPLGVFELVYASGENWYGEELKFGPNTQYTKSDSLLAFQKLGLEINGHTINLKSVVGGNMTSQAMSANDF
jgi:hypothetical protein